MRRWAFGALDCPLTYAGSCDAVQAFAGIVTVSVGHCHPRVVDAVKRQSELLQHTTTIYLNPQIALYAKELTDRLPGNLKVREQTLFLCLHDKSASLHKTDQASMATHALSSIEVMQPLSVTRRMNCSNRAKMNWL